jgi:heat shock protein HslJ
VAARKEQVSRWHALRHMMRISMSKWPVFLLFATTACAYPPELSDRPPAAEPLVYRALGQEPGWTVTITEERIHYVGDYGETRITVPTPDPRTTFNGHRYETKRLIVDITHDRCNDVMSGHGYGDTVMVIVDGETFYGCGGKRRRDWDV